MSNVTELRLTLSELNHISIPCGKCATRVLMDCNDEERNIPEECPSCHGEYGEDFRNLLRTYRNVYRQLSAFKQRPVEVRISIS